MLSQPPATSQLATRDNVAQLQLVRRYSKLLRESAAAARSTSTQRRRGAAPGTSGRTASRMKSA